MMGATTLMPTIPFNSPLGLDLFQDISPGEANVDILSSYTPQQHRNFCGVASIVTLLAAGRKDGTRFLHPVDDATFLDHENLFSERVSQVRTLEQVKGMREGDYPGLSFENQAAILALFFSQVEMVYGSQLDEESFLNLLNREVIDRRMKPIVNFDASVFHSGMGGHVAPVVALHMGKKMLLIADPAQHKTGWYWVRVPDILVSMQRIRKGNTKSRGLIVVK